MLLGVTKIFVAGDCMDEAMKCAVCVQSFLLASFKILVFCKRRTVDNQADDMLA